MDAEFDTVAEWTAQVAVKLGPDFYVPAACRGSGSPAALDWLIDHMRLVPGDRLLDCGAGTGGPAAYPRRPIAWFGGYPSAITFAAVASLPIRTAPARSVACLSGSSNKWA